MFCSTKTHYELANNVCAVQGKRGKLGSSAFFFQIFSRTQLQPINHKYYNDDTNPVYDWGGGRGGTMKTLKIYKYAYPRNAPAMCARTSSGNNNDAWPSLSFSCSNEYPPVDQSSWSHLAEPFRETTLRASTGDEEASSGDVFVWEFEDERRTMLEGR